LGRIYATLGIDPVPSGAAVFDIPELAREIRRGMQDWQRGRIVEPVADAGQGPALPTAVAKDVAKDATSPGSSNVAAATPEATPASAQKTGVN
jgi:hypothetical protein